MVAERGVEHGSGAGQSGFWNMVAGRGLEHGSGAGRSGVWNMVAERDGAGSGTW